VVTAHVPRVGGTAHDGVNRVNVGHIHRIRARGATVVPALHCHALADATPVDRDGRNPSDKAHAR